MIELNVTHNFSKISLLSKYAYLCNTIKTFEFDYGSLEPAPMLQFGLRIVHGIIDSISYAINPSHWNNSNHIGIPKSLWQPESHTIYKVSWVGIVTPPWLHFEIAIRRSIISPGSFGFVCFFVRLKLDWLDYLHPFIFCFPVRNNQNDKVKLEAD